MSPKTLSARIVCLPKPTNSFQLGIFFFNISERGGRHKFAKSSSNLIAWDERPMKNRLAQNVACYSQRQRLSQSLVVPLKLKLLSKVIYTARELDGEDLSGHLLHDLANEFPVVSNKLQFLALSDLFSDPV